MKTVRYLFAMIIGAVLLQGTSFASQSNSVPQQTPSPSREGSAGDSSEGQKDSQARSEKNQTGEERSEGEPNTPERRTRGATQRRPNQNHAKPALGRQVRSGKTPVASSRQPQTRENGMGFHQTGSSTASRVPNRTVRRRSAPVPPAAVAVNGQQFKSPRDPGARLTSSGGALTASRGTAAISGSNMKRKP